MRTFRVVLAMALLVVPSVTRRPAPARVCTQWGPRRALRLTQGQHAGQFGGVVRLCQRYTVDSTTERL